MQGAVATCRFSPEASVRGTRSADTGNIVVETLADMPGNVLIALVSKEPQETLPRIGLSAANRTGRVNSPRVRRLNSQVAQ